MGFGLCVCTTEYTSILSFSSSLYQLGMHDDCGHATERERERERRKGHTKNEAQKKKYQQQRITENKRTYVYA